MLVVLYELTVEMALGLLELEELRRIEHLLELREIAHLDLALLALHLKEGFGCLLALEVSGLVALVKHAFFHAACIVDEFARFSLHSVVKSEKLFLLLLGQFEFAGEELVLVAGHFLHPCLAVSLGLGRGGHHGGYGRDEKKK